VKRDRFRGLMLREISPVITIAMDRDVKVPQKAGEDETA
jgi:hypothetical protein